MNVINKAFRRLLNSEMAQEIRMNFMSGDKRIQARLEEICRQCPQQKGGECSSPDEERQQQIRQCRKKFFGVLLESFLGKPGDAETDRLYAYFESCERCLKGDFYRIGSTKSQKSRRQV